MAWLILCSLVLVGCTRPDMRPPATGNDALIFDAHRVARADRIAIFVPGALTSVRMFAPARGWTQSGYAPAYYRFPGLDGRTLDGPLDLDRAADRIAKFAARHPEKDIALIGYSSGAPIAIMAAARITDGRIVPVAAVSPAVERAGGLPTLLRGGTDLARAAVRASTLDRLEIWVEYWQILLYGRNATPDPTFRQRVLARATTHQGDRRLGPPDPNLARSHASKLSKWDIPENLDLDHVRLRIFTGQEDPVFSTAQTLRFARKLGQDRIYAYPGDGHLLYLTQPDVFDTARLYADQVLAEHRTP